MHECDFDRPSSAPAGIPGNDDQAAMASLLSFHLLGLYPGELINSCFIGDCILNMFSPIDDTASYPIAFHTQIHHSQLVLERQHHRYDCQFRPQINSENNSR
jgi:hypothetical protein